jgi:uncharacterized membrane protein YcaP (DUF421 family)
LYRLLERAEHLVGFVKDRAFSATAPVPQKGDMESTFGTEHHVDLVQACMRAALVFAYGFLILRLGGRRCFGKWSALDFIISIIIGSCLARVITGEAPIAGTFAAVAVMLALHFLLAWAVSHSETMSRIIEGRTIILSHGAEVDEKVRKAHLVSHADIAEAMRDECLEGLEDLRKTKRLHLEPSGKISVVKRD